MTCVAVEYESTIILILWLGAVASPWNVGALDLVTLVLFVPITNARACSLKGVVQLILSLYLA